jgi:hypothetical protein
MDIKTIADFSDAELARMVRESIYAQGAVFGGPGEDGYRSRFLIVLAVPYGEDDGVETLPEAIDAFVKLLRDDDWQERSFQVYDHSASLHFYTVAREDCGVR